MEKYPWDKWKKTILYEHDLNRVEANQCEKYLLQRPFGSEVIVWTQIYRQTKTYTRPIAVSGLLLVCNFPL